MKIYELKQIIRECIDELELNEGLKRLDRLHNSSKQDSQSKEVRKKHDDDFHVAANKILRRNEKGQDKYGAVGFANKRSKGK